MVIRAQGSLNLSHPPTLFLTSTNIYQTQGLWLWCPILGAVAVIPGPQFSSAILGKVGNASGAGGTSAGMKVESLGSQIRLVLDLHCRAETSPSSPHKSGQQKQKWGEYQNTGRQKYTNSLSLGKGGRSWGIGETGDTYQNVSWQGSIFLLRSGQFSPLPTTEMAQDEALAE